MSHGHCCVCGRQAAQEAVPFFCVKSSELTGGTASIYRFETPVCGACVKERAARRTRRYWTTSLAITAVVTVAASIAAWIYLGNDPSGTIEGRVFGASFLACVAGGVVLLFAGVISIQVCSSKFVAVQLAVKAQQAKLDAEGYAGYWMAPPKHLTVRR